MKALVIIALAAATAHAEPDVSVSTDLALARHGVGLDVDLAGGVGFAGKDSYGARARIGAVLFHEPNFVSLGVAGMVSPLGSSALGFEVGYGEVFRGFTAQAGCYPVDSVGGAIVSAQVGWALFGVEYQRRIAGPAPDQAVIAVVHLPLGTIYQMLKQPPGVI